MLDIQKKAIEKFLSVLDGAGAKYKIVLDDGTEYGELQVVQKKEIKRKSPILPMGTYTNYFRPHMETLPVGGVLALPFNDLDPETLRGSVSSWAITNWGKGSVTTMLNHAEQRIEVLRLS